MQKVSFQLKFSQRLKTIPTVLSFVGRVREQWPSASVPEDRKLLRRACGMRGIASVVYPFLSESVERRLAGLNVSLTQDWPGRDGAFKERLSHSVGTRRALVAKTPEA